MQRTACRDWLYAEKLFQGVIFMLPVVDVMMTVVDSREPIMVHNTATGFMQKNCFEESFHAEKWFLSLISYREVLSDTDFMQRSAFRD